MIRLTVALPSEARPLVDHFGLKAGNRRAGFRIFCGERAVLVVTGVGKLNAAAGAAYLAGVFPGENVAWLNVGVAGHESHPTGTCAHAIKITDHHSGRNWYPPKVIQMPGLGVHLSSYDQPVEEYPLDRFCEMEASAYYSMATRFSPGEIVQCFKIVSDNAGSPSSEITPARVTQLVSDRISDIDRFSKSLIELAQRLPAHDVCENEMREMTKRWHFTATQTFLLTENLRRMRVRNVPELMQIESWQHCSSAKEVLIEMNHKLMSLPVKV